MTKEELKRRTRAFHIAVIKACEMLPGNAAGFELAKQLIRCAGVSWSKLQGSMPGKVHRRFYYKIEIIIEEADESMYWLEVCDEAKIIKQ